MPIPCWVGKMIPHREVRQGRLGVTEILSDLLLLFSCLAAFIVGIVVAAASLLSLNERQVVSRARMEVALPRIKSRTPSG